MPCCVTLLKSLQYAESSSFDDDNDLYDPVVVEKFYNNRPQREGMFFLCHRDHLTDIMETASDYLIGEPVSIWEDFFRFHPVRHPLCQEFVSLCLPMEFVEKHSDFINMASYRWLDVHGVGEYGKGYHAPTNYVWFLEWLKENKRLGWMDFMANIVVNVDTDHTVAYMGDFYARLPTIAQWMLDPDLLGSALNRAWIYQESAFGAFVSEGIDIVLDDIRSLGLSLCSPSRNHNHAVIEKFELCRKFCRRAEHMAKLLDRRGYFAFATKQEILKDRQYEYYGGAPYYDMDGKVTAMVLERAFEGEKVDDAFRQEIDGIIGSGYSKGYTAMYHLCEFFTAPADDEEFPIVYNSIHKLCTMRTWEDCHTAEEFFERIGDPLLAAYSTLDVSYESDREPSVTKVALSIMERDYENAMGSHDFCEAVWKGSADMCLKTSEESSGLGLVSSSKVAFQPAILSGKRFLGGVHVSGALIDSNGAYATANGSRSAGCDWILVLVTGFGEEFQYDENKEAWIKEEDGIECCFDIYFCDAPTKTNFFCSIVCVLRDEENDERRPFCAWFYTSRAVPDFPKPAEGIEVF